MAGVRREDADAYAVWLSDRTGHPWRLPTEAEWEHAAKGPDGREFPWGDTFDPAAANTRESGVHTTTPVGAFPAGVSPFGVYDMAGNVEEFTADDYRPHPGGPFVADHLVETMNTYRVARGGSFSRFGDLTRTRRRHGAFPGPCTPWASAWPRADGRGRRRRHYGTTTIFLPTPDANCSSASGYRSSGMRSLMKTSGSRTPFANSSAARSKLCSTAIEPVMVISWL